MDKERVFAFDLGVSSIGECIRSGSKIEHIKTHLIPEETASITEQAKRRRQLRSRIAHKKREEWWRKCAEEAGIEVLETRQPVKDPKTGKFLDCKPDTRMLREFPAEGDKTIYTSCLLRIALLQGVKLEGWQIYKAIWSAMQHRGYDAHLTWKREKGSKKKKKDAEKLTEKEQEEQKNLQAVNAYRTELTSTFGNKEEFCFPCYLEALKIGVWSPENPKDLSGKIGTAPSPARNKYGKNTLVSPRELVENELKLLLRNASLQYPALKDKEFYVLYGPAGKPYASLFDSRYKKFRGRDWEWQGVLSQKVPRFDNRIIAKCRLIPRLNVCKAENELNRDVVFLQSLKNMRFFDADNRLVALDVKALNEIYKEFYDKKRVTPSKWDKIVKEHFGGNVHPNQLSTPEPKITGRSSFSRPALRILKELLLSGKSPHVLYEELCSNNKNMDKQKGLVKEDYAFLLRIPPNWEDFTIPDERGIDGYLEKAEREEKISEILNGITNSIVRHRLKVFTQRLKELSSSYGIPDRVVIELVRDTKTGFMSETRKKHYIKVQKENTASRDRALEKLKEFSLEGTGERMLLKMMLFEEQCGIDPYSLKTLKQTDLEHYEIDHIVPLSRGGSDAYINKVLTTNKNNNDKLNKTPYEWLSGTDIWLAYLDRMKQSGLSAKKKELLTSENACELIEKYAMLAATAYVAKLAQRITALMFNWPQLLRGTERKIFVASGGYTAKIRRKFHLDALLHEFLREDEFVEMVKEGDIEEKNRANPKHHALDALVISLLPYLTKPFSGKSEMELAPGWFNPEFCREALKRVLPEQLAFKKPVLAETIYAKRFFMENGREKYYFVTHFGPGTKIEDFYKLSEAKKYVPSLFDPKMRKDLSEKLEDENITEEEWKEFILDYQDKNHVKRILKKESGTLEKGMSVEFAEIGKMKGQYYKDKKEHKGQIVYEEKEGRWKVMPVYVFESSFEKLNLFKEKYGKAFFFQSQQLVYIANNCPGTAKIKRADGTEEPIYNENGKDEISSGTYILKTIKAKGQVKISSLDGAITILSSVNNLFNIGRMRPVKQKK